MKKFLLYTIFILATVSVLGQSKSIISGDGRFVATVDYLDKNAVSGQHEYEARVYSVAYKTLIKAFRLRYEKSLNIDSLRLSHTGKMLYVGTKEDRRIYNTRVGNMLFRTNEPMEFAMANQDNFFVVSAPSFVKALDAYTGEEITNYKTAPNNQIKELYITQDDEHIAAITFRKQILFWQVGRERARKKYFGDDIVFKTNGKGFTVARKVGTQLNVYNYELPTFKRINKLSIDKVLREDARERTMALRESDPSQKRTIINPSKSLHNDFLLSQVGNYIAILAKSPEDEKELYVINTNTGTVKLREVVGDLKQEIALNWYSDSLLIPQNMASPRVYNANTNAFENNLKLKFLYSKKKGLFAKRQEWSNKNISSNFKWAISQKEDALLMSYTSGNEGPRKFPGFQFLGFSTNALFAYAKNNAGQKFYAELRGLKSVNAVKWIPLQEEERLYMEPEMGNVAAPNSYNFVRIKGMRHISEAGPTDTLRLLMKTVETGSKAGVQVQIVDQNGIYYYGAGTEDFKGIWCNLMVKGSDGKIRQIDDFSITEYSEMDSLPNAIATIMDFSGSMGWPRADALQEGVEKFINAKKEKDEVALFKYDHRVVQESDLLDKKERLIRKLYHLDFSSFGGATALLDATNAGIFGVKKARNVSRKIVIVMTDGNENSSLITKNEVLKNALENGVNIYTIGYGNQVNQGYLKSLSYNTRGGHYQIYDVADFEWIYNDIYKKSLNYYSVNYKTADKGSQVYLLKICKDGLNSDSVVVEFENNPADLAVLANTLADYKDNPVAASGFSEINTKGFNKPNLKQFSKVKMEQPLLPKRIRIYEDSLTTIEDEFSTIKLPRFNFDYDRVTTVKETESRILDLIAFLKKYPQVNLEIIGHTDNSGESDYNDDLSLRRAKRVKELIVDMGGDSNRLVIRGFGETAPVASNATEEGRAKNRRVEFNVIERK
ncbi:OmpA family protein [Luteibaculum oceani]|uniref:OmpA family protein n=1 Tax=Luteibaculum oceani TaxID=1294296 RepID=A0A5C6UXX3_9FLAO|nr:OmpA family protein [Luteibaculum oceani]TXC78333.1 OmpA family protein [Luteibaculum oceani]